VLYLKTNFTGSFVLSIKLQTIYAYKMCVCVCVCRRTSVFLQVGHFKFY